MHLSESPVLVISQCRVSRLKLTWCAVSDVSAQLREREGFMLVQAALCGELSSLCRENELERESCSDPEQDLPAVRRVGREAGRQAWGQRSSAAAALKGV